MSKSFKPDVALARVQTVYAVLQTARDAIAFPQSKNLILPTGDVAANQTTPVTDSREKADTLDVRNVFQGIASPAEVPVSMYLRTDGMDVQPQGEDLLIGLQGAKAEPAIGVLKTDITASDATLALDEIDGVFPERGVLSVGAELIHYRTISITGLEATFSNLTRGYKNTTAEAHMADASVDLRSAWYRQSTSRPYLTLWVQTDETMQCVQDCKVVDFTLQMATSDAVEMQFSLTGRRLWNAGPSTMTESAISGASTVKVKNAACFFVGQKAYNATKKTAAHTVSMVDERTNTITFAESLSEAWAVDDVVTWWLPGGEPIGREVENRDTTMRVAGVRGAMLPGSIKITTPVSFTEEVGDRFPGEGIDDTRSCSIDYNVLMRKDAALRLRQGFEGQEVRYDAEFGVEDGHRMTLIAPRMKLTTASVSFQSPTVSLSTSGRLLGTGKGENSVQLILE